MDIPRGIAAIFSNLLFLLFLVAFMALDAAGFASRLSKVRPQQPEVIGALHTFVHGSAATWRSPPCSD